MAFEYAGTLGGAGAPVVRRFAIGTDLYVGNFVTPDQGTTGLGGQVRLAELASEAFEDDQPLFGFVSAIADKSRVYVPPATGYAYGDRSTRTATKTTILANQTPHQSGGGEVDVTLALPMRTLIRAPLFDATFGTKMPTIVNQTADTGGTTVVAASTVLDIADNFGTIYCRSGQNRGQYRVIYTVDTASYTVKIPFPYTIAVDDVYVAASCSLGLGGMDFTTGIDAIDGDNDMNYYYNVYYHEINLEEAGREYAIFSLWNQSAEAVT
jgi:hypothetical protein